MPNVDPAVQEMTPAARHRLMIEAVEAAFAKMQPHERDAIIRECVMLRRGLEALAPNIRIGEQGLREILALMGMWMLKQMPAVEQVK